MGTSCTRANAHTLQTIKKTLSLQHHLKRVHIQPAYLGISIQPNFSRSTHKQLRIIAIAFTMILIMPALLFAATSTNLAWDGHDQQIDGYRVFQRVEGEDYNYSEWIYQGQTPSHTVNGLQDGVTYYFVVRAYSGDIQSIDSNEISYRYDPVPPTEDYTISASANNGGTISPAGDVTVEEGQNKSFTISAQSGYQISDVKVDGVSQGAISNYVFSNVTANHNIVASFSAVAPQTHTINATAGTGGTISPSGNVTVQEGQNKSFTISAQSGYQISDVKVDGVSKGAISNYEFSNVTANHNIVASFSAVAPQTHTINATAGTGGTISPSGNVTVQEGQNKSFTISAQSGYQISDVKVDGVSQGAISNYNFSNVTANHSIVASFSTVAPQTHTIQATAGANGSISPAGNVTVENGQDQEFSISADSGYMLADVLVDGASLGDIAGYAISYGTYKFSNVTANHSITASFMTRPSDLPPLADAGGMLEVNSKDRVTLDGSGCSDPEGSALSYQWVSLDNSINLRNAQTAHPRFRAPEVTEGSTYLQFELTVTNDKNLSASDTCLVKVNAKPDPATDTDGDGIPDDTDTDDDNDGMPDAWELQYGFNPLDHRDADEDPDNDGVSNLDEYKNQTNPLSPDDNQAPAKPVIIYPEESDNAVDLTPQLQAGDFEDADPNDSHTKSQWRIQSADGQHTVYDVFTKAGQLTHTKVPCLILDPATDYIVQVRYYDNADAPSEWSDPVAFTTIEDSKDKNNNRIPDDQEVETETDLNRDSIPDREQGGEMKRVRSYDQRRIMGISIESSSTALLIEAVANLDPSELDATPLPEEAMPYGVANYRIRVAEPGQSAQVKIFLNDPIDEQMPWVRYDDETGWETCLIIGSMDNPGSSYERNLVDGGEDDLDGTANGVIVDRLGPQDENSGGRSLDDDDNAASSGNSNSCFIQSLF